RVDAAAFLSFSFTPTAPTYLYTLSLHDALPISSCPIETPAKSRSTTNAVIPSSVLANTRYTAATCAFVIHCFSPFRRNPSSFFLAVVFVANASEPAPGSVSAYAPILSPEVSLGRYICFCSSVPKYIYGDTPTPVWILKETPKLLP